MDRQGLDNEENGTCGQDETSNMAHQGLNPSQEVRSFWLSSECLGKGCLVLIISEEGKIKGDFGGIVLDFGRRSTSSSIKKKTSQTRTPSVTNICKSHTFPSFCTREANVC